MVVAIFWWLLVLEDSVATITMEGVGFTMFRDQECVSDT